ncbi:cell division protein FtsL [Xanthomonadaceae bacterium JHOS43]|nr:cell division protein FtsL [Xanthomonadaceae bacterium JHOS43]MCX7563021.1 cell division protein FtsL [Xanthomonadaceae bacterium XH05]
MSWRWLVLSLLTLATAVSAIGVAYSRHQHRVAFAQLSALERARDELNIEFDRLQIEIATLADTSRIEQQAASRLGMRFPEGAEVVVVKP